LFMAFWGEPSPFVREHLTGDSHSHQREGHTHHGGDIRHQHAGEAPFSMTWTVAVLAVLAGFGGWIQFAGLWTPITTRLGAVRELAAAVRVLGLGTGRLQSGLVRTYTLAIAASLAVLTIVFVVVR